MDINDMAALLGSWEIALRDEGKSKNTVRAYGSSVRALMSWQEQSGTFGLTKAATAGFLGAVLDGWHSPDAIGTKQRGGEASTANLRSRSIRLFSAWCAAEGEIDTDELAGLKAPKPNKTIVPKLSDDQLRAMIAACAADKTLYGRRDEAMVRLASESTSRADELLCMDIPGDLDLKRMIAVIRRGKGAKGRIVPFGDHTARAIDRYLRLRRKAGLPDDGPLWISQRKGRLSYPGLYSTLGKRARAAGIPDFHPHRLRHTAASRWLRAGGSEGGLMAIAGWQSRDMLDRYVEDTRAEMAVAEAQKLGLGDI
jgi:integrase/recombinase XerD